jgi:hypothetical protein
MTNEMPGRTLEESLAYRRGYLDAMDRGRKSTQKTHCPKAYESGFVAGTIVVERIKVQCAK